LNRIASGIVAVMATLTPLAFGPGTAFPKTFVYVSAATDGIIDTYNMDETMGVLTPSAKFDAGTMVMPMTVSPDKKHLSLCS
jgi:6-phosphogluconolactonase